jgi:molybdate transport repressor ModE-like protein
LDWDRLKVFQAVAVKGSFNAAAKSLGLSYNKVVKDVEELEHALGRQLFDRSNRGLDLTAVGEDILESARTMADSVQAIINRANDNTPGQVVICARDGIASYWLARHLPDLLEMQPQAKIAFRILPTTPSLLEGEGDIAIQFEPPTVANVVAKQLGWLHYLPYASADYIARRGEPASMFDLKNHQCLRLSEDANEAENWRLSAPAWDALIPSAVETNAGSVLMEACASGAGIAPLPSYVSEISRDLVPLAHSKPLATVRFWLAYTERVRNTPACEPVLRWIRKCFDPILHPCFREVYIPPTRGANGPPFSARSML